MNRAGASNLLQVQSSSEMSRVVRSGLEFSGEADSAGFVGAKEIHAEVSQEGEVLGGVAQANQACIFPKGHVETPMQAVFDGPVCSDGMKDAATVSGKRTDHVTLFGRNLSANVTCRFDAGNRRELRPARLQAEEAKPIEFADCGAASSFDQVMPLVQSLVQRDLPSAVPWCVQRRK
jgi:hypothetical protein